jgi:hypothetical protein
VGDLFQLACLIFASGVALVGFAILSGARAVRELADAIRNRARDHEEW